MLTRTTVARFNTEGFLRADVRTRWEVYEKAVAVLGTEGGAAYARQHEGIDTPSTETAPVAMPDTPNVAAIPEV